MCPTNNVVVYSTMAALKIMELKTASSSQNLSQRKSIKNVTEVLPSKHKCRLTNNSMTDILFSVACYAHKF